MRGALARYYSCSTAMMVTIASGDLSNETIRGEGSWGYKRSEAHKFFRLSLFSLWNDLDNKRGKTG